MCEVSEVFSESECSEISFENDFYAGVARITDLGQLKDAGSLSDHFR